MNTRCDRSSCRLLMFTPRPDHRLPRLLAFTSRQLLTFPAAPPRRLSFSVRFSETLRRLLESEAVR